MRRLSTDVQLMDSAAPHLLILWEKQKALIVHFARSMANQITYTHERITSYGSTKESRKA